jgi:prepilin-type N-terminal cleavage/methylation domain-containing protein
MQVTRRGFTIVELLIATFIFLIGFVSVYGLFLRAVQFRREGENMVRCSLAASSIVATMRLKIRADTTFSPVNYQGSGSLVSPNGDEVNKFYAYLDQPGIFYRISEASQLMAGKTNVAKFTVQTVFLGSPAPNGFFTKTEVLQRLGVTSPTDEDQKILDLVTSGAITQRIAIIAPR